jgi:hypothetical protein
MIFSPAEQVRAEHTMISARGGRNIDFGHHRPGTADAQPATPLADALRGRPPGRRAADGRHL